MTYLFVYKFTLHEPSDENARDFVEIWSRMTDYFRDECGAEGSRLHRAADGSFFAYAQWPTKAVADASGDREPGPEFISLRLKWAELCAPSEVVFEGELVADMLA